MMLKKLRKTVLFLAAAGILFVWLAVVGMWVRSYWRGDAIVATRTVVDSEIHSGSTYVLLSGEGGMALANRRWTRPNTAGIVVSPPQTRWDVYNTPGYPQPATVRFTGTLTITGVSLSPAGPTTAAARYTLQNAGGGTMTISGSSGTLNVSVGGGPPTTVPSGAVIAMGSGQGFTVQPATSVQLTTGGGGGGINVTGGTLVFGAPGPTTMGTALGNAAIAPPSTPPAGSHQFFAYTAGSPVPDAQQNTDISRVLIFPYWALQIVLTLPLLYVIRVVNTARIRRRRRISGCCIQCGYDLRASPDRCPECGAIVCTTDGVADVAGKATQPHAPS